MTAPVPISYLLYTDELAENIRNCYWHELAAYGVKHVILDARMLPMIMEKPALAALLTQELENAGLSFMDAHAPYGIHWDLNCTFEEERPSLLLRQKLSIAIAASLGIKTMTIHAGTDHLFPNIPHETHFSRICSMLDPLLVEAEKHDIILAVENGWTRTTSTETLLALKEKFPTDYLGFCYDSGHANIMDSGRLFTEGEAYSRWNAIGIKTPPWEDAVVKLKRMLPDVVNCHLHDNYGNADQHALPGNGNVKWDKIIPLLRKAPRLQAIQCEVNLERNALPVKHVTEAFEKLFKQEIEQ